MRILYSASWRRIKIADCTGKEIGIDWNHGLRQLQYTHTHAAPNIATGTQRSVGDTRSMCIQNMYSSPGNKGYIIFRWDYGRSVDQIDYHAPMQSISYSNEKCCWIRFVDWVKTFALVLCVFSLSLSEFDKTIFSGIAFEITLNWYAMKI